MLQIFLITPSFTAHEHVKDEGIVSLSSTDQVAFGKFDLAVLFP